MLYWISRIFRQAFGFRQVDRNELRCTVCRTLHRDAGPLVEGLDNFLVCTSCVQRLSETEPLPVEAEGTEFVSSARSNAENPYEPPTTDRNSRVASSATIEASRYARLIICTLFVLTASSYPRICLSLLPSSSPEG